MIQEERKNFILAELTRTSVVKFEDLAPRLHVSVDTIRRDLKLLEREGLLQCIRGGAKALNESPQYYHFKGRKIVHTDLKREASRKALQLLHPDDVIMLNSGTTNTIFAEELAQTGLACTIITNNIAAAEAASMNPNCQIQIIGGDWDASEQSSWGGRCLRELRHFYPDICILSINSLHKEAGMTDFRFHEIPIIQTMQTIAHQTVAVMDSTKLDRTAKELVFRPVDCPPVIMDDHIPDAVKIDYNLSGFHII